jgi:hypothetical protein
VTPPYCPSCHARSGLGHLQGCQHKDGELYWLMRRAREAFDALTPEQQAAFRREQAIDWAYGQLMASTNHREGVTRELVAEQYDKRRGAPSEEPGGPFIDPYDH